MPMEKPFSIREYACGIGNAHPALLHTLITPTHHSEYTNTAPRPASTPSCSGAPHSEYTKSAPKPAPTPSCTGLGAHLPVREQVQYWRPAFSVLFSLRSTQGLHPHPTAQVVQAFLSGNMCGIGDALYHLELWGLRLVHVQHAVDELDFSVHSLQEDLRWGCHFCMCIILWMTRTSACTLVYTACSEDLRF